LQEFALRVPLPRWKHPFVAQKTGSCAPFQAIFSARCTSNSCSLGRRRLARPAGAVPDVP